MTITLHFGVVDVPYATHDPVRRVVTRHRKGSPVKQSSAPAGGAETTGDVADWLEMRYHVVESFYEDVGEQLLAKALEKGLQGAMLDLESGRSPDMVKPFKRAENEVKAAFDFFISQKEMDGTFAGVPTKASLKGVNHRLAHPYAKDNPARPSFDDTGTYMAAFRMETEER